MQLIADNLACERGGRMVFAGLAFTIAAGEALVVTGANGVGKSSLLRVIAGLVAPAEGSLRIAGVHEDVAVGARCHYFGHADALKTPLTVSENLAFWRDYAGRHRASVNAALETVGLAEIGHLPAAYLSAGQRRRLSLARLLVSHRAIWLLDEPTSALDTASQATLRDLMHAHMGEGGMIVAATHTDLPVSPARHLHLAPGEVSA